MRLEMGGLADHPSFIAQNSKLTPLTLIDDAVGLLLRPRAGIVSACPPWALSAPALGSEGGQPAPVSETCPPSGFRVDISPCPPSLSTLGSIPGEGESEGGQPPPPSPRARTA